MSEEKLYVIKSRSDDKFYFSGNRMIPNWNDELISLFGSYEIAKEIAEDNNGQPATFVEEPEKEAVSESVGGAIDSLINADTYVQAAAAFQYLFASRKKKDFKRIMKAVRNGYTVKKNKYRVLAPKSWWYDDDAPLYLFFDFNDGMRFTVKKDNPSTLFTKEQLSAFGLDGEYFQKEEVTDDDD
ncbi:hypothetical protein [Lacticaseibacillus paracasei]|uniref:hypothetical protein n=1 Tax=Lacticaseibacillus paracasei TaxID=1597 RepID=UPI0031F61C51